MQKVATQNIDRRELSKDDGAGIRDELGCVAVVQRIDPMLDRNNEEGVGLGLRRGVRIPAQKFIACLDRDKWFVRGETGGDCNPVYNVCAKDIAIAHL